MSTEVTAWQKASASDQNNCVELRRNGDAVEIRDSKHPLGATLRYSGAELAAWIEGAKNGEFDDLAT